MKFVCICEYVVFWLLICFVDKLLWFYIVCVKLICISWREGIYDVIEYLVVFIKLKSEYLRVNEFNVMEVVFFLF